MIHFSLSNFNVLYVYLAPRAKPEGLKRARGVTDAIPRFRETRKEREHHNTMKNTAQEGARGRAGRDSPPPQQPLDILYLQKFFVKGKIAVKWRARAVRHAGRKLAPLGHRPKARHEDGSSPTEDG